MPSFNRAQTFLTRIAQPPEVVQRLKKLLGERRTTRGEAPMIQLKKLGQIQLRMDTERSVSLGGTAHGNH